MDNFTKLAKQALETYIKTGEKPAPPKDVPAEMKERAAVFVSLKEDGRLRGCIGSLEPTMPDTAEEIITYAIYAGTRDPRFMPVNEEELDKLSYSVDVLGKPEPVSDIGELDPSVYGVIVSDGRRRGVLLPDLEGVDTAEEQIEIALAKAGIPKTANYQTEKFKVTRHK